MLNSYLPNNCSQILTTYLYFTNKKKIIPESNITILNVKHVNTAYTVDCLKKSEIIVYRKEEWFKVFIHETIHNFSLDFASMNLNKFNEKIKGLFPINIEFNVYESYCETWARMINILFCSYTSLNLNDKKNLNFNKFYFYFEGLLKLELTFSLYQCNKVLDFMGLTYNHLNNHTSENIITISNLYRENTSVFSYYILTSLFLTNYTYFLKWCKTNNDKIIRFKKSESNLNEFYLFIKQFYKNKTFIDNLNYIKMMSNKHNKDFGHLNQSLRMTLLELNI
jgi:hypothetical protein